MCDIDSVLLIVVLEVITEQRGGDLENLYKICRDEYEKFRPHSKRNENGKYIRTYILLLKRFILDYFGYFVNS